MTTWELIRSMVQRGYEFQLGPHDKCLRGYWACFIPVKPHIRKSDGREEERFNVWSDCGHAMTPHRAVVMAAKVALGEQVAPPNTRFLL